MFNFRDFDKIFNEILLEQISLNSSFSDDNNWTKKTYKSPNGSFYYTYMARKTESDDLYKLKEKLILSVEDQNFEEAVKLRDKIKKLEENKEKISELQSKLDESIKNQKFEKSIEYRDQINKLK
jgi:protein-arginine kinase activator protein McsA